MKLDKKHLQILKLWTEVEDIKVIDFNMYNHDRGGVRINNLYKVFSDNRNFSTHIVFTSPDIHIKKDSYNLKDLDLLFGGEDE